MLESSNLIVGAVCEMGLQQQSLLPRKCSFTLAWLSEEEMGCWMKNAVQEQYTHEACSSAGPAACWVTAKLGATELGFFHVHGELFLANNLFLASLFP